MSQDSSKRTADQPAATPLTRRRVFAGAGTAGALAAAAAVLPLSPSPAPEVTDTQAPSTNGRYQVTEHVLRYYQTARV